MRYDPAEVRSCLEPDEIFNLLEYLDAEPKMLLDNIVCKTVCHGGDSHKLYYYFNSNLFRCYTGDCGVFDIFELFEKVKDVSFSSAVDFVVEFCKLGYRISEIGEDSSEDLKIIERYKQLLSLEVSHEFFAMPEIDGSILEHYPSPRIVSWEQEGISKEVCDYMGIKYDPLAGSILIPHRDFYGRLIGIRERTLVKDNESMGKYRPAIIDTKQYNHPLGYNLYGIDVAKDNIAKAKVAIVAEGEKAVLSSIGYLGTASNITVATCGNKLSEYQCNLLIDKCGVREIVIAFDSDYHEPGDADYERVISNLQKIYDQFSPKVNISFMFDKEKQYLPYKASPFDCGKDVFMKLWRDRVML